MDWEKQASEFVEILLEEEAEKALSLTRKLLGQGVTPTEFFEKCITPALEDIGGRFERLDIFLPEMVEAAEIVEQINNQVIKPALAESLARGDVQSLSGPVGKVCLATIQGDLHDIGKNMVALMLQVNGFEVIDMGTNVAPAAIIERAAQEDADIIGLSSLLTSCLPYMKDVVDFLEGQGTRDRYAVVVGGAAPTAEFVAEIGANAHGHTAAEAVTICKKIMAA
jgi:methylmalonyl-CoA mutase cobalamin-binding domain/chain